VGNLWGYLHDEDETRNPCSLHAGGAIDADDLAVDPLAVLGSQEANDTGNVDGETDPVERRPASGILQMVSSL